MKAQIMRELFVSFYLLSLFPSLRPIATTCQRGSFMIASPLHIRQRRSYESKRGVELLGPYACDDCTTSYHKAVSLTTSAAPALFLSNSTMTL